MSIGSRICGTVGNEPSCWKGVYGMKPVTLWMAAATSVGLVAIPARAAAPESIGSAILVVNQVTAAIAAETRTLRTGDDVRQNELIEVSKTSKGEIRLNDDTKLALGPGSRLMLDRFVYSPDKTGNAIMLNMIEGTFRFITGLAKKPSYIIRTPSAAITVRGTIFDTYVMASGEAWVLLQEGGVSVCNIRGDCRTLDEPGKMIPVTASGEIGKPVRWADLGGIDGSIFDRAFPFVREVPSIDPSPVFTREALLETLSDRPVDQKRERIAKSQPKDEEERSTPRRKAKFVGIEMGRKRHVFKVVERDDDEDGDKVVKPRRPVGVRLPGRGIKIKKPKDVDKAGTEYPKSERRGKFLRAALGAAVIAGSLGSRGSSHYPKQPGGGEMIGHGMPGRSSLGGSILKEMK